ncbi:MAG: DNA repair exonuclease [Firmicutes bacterium]|jgi:DNA repair exonuclease SbcCD nuclease subunit|uniref:DNA repair exonuclease n=1 Tax=Sulfobacillus benefaciens TaxID=453960 RepID=A0A2T2WY15_9FIRM|nr:DNA repair exonuclease [Bacillota bacterium]MCL5015310.1 DNA repair exonuclease [Bacillota bacterium]PSR27128.1 MAG: DNA repair exonuclease [Sulfobacillus benefaciens]HBQ95720.1 DNA repair exonuclease [Sulfobacillus sp.]
MFKFVHCADLHLDSPLRGLAAKEDAPVDMIRSATRRALNNLVNLAISEKVRFVVIAGDLFDGDWPDYSTGLFFNGLMGRLNDAGIDVYIVRGNHDAASNITRHLVWPPNVHEFSTKHPQTFVIDDLAVALHGQGFSRRETVENLVLQYPDAHPGYVNIGVLHTSLEGHEGHETYAPCSLSDLIHKHYDYWALGHVHKRQVVRESDPCIVYPGNLQGRHIRETGEKGCTLVTVDNGFFTLEHRSLDVLRWYLAEVDLSEANNQETFVERVVTTFQQYLEENQGSPLALRLHFLGETSLHGRLLAESEYFYREIENAVAMTAPGQIWIEKVKFMTSSPARSGQWSQQMDALARLANSMQEVEEDEEFLEEFLRHVERIQTRLKTYVNSEGAMVIHSLDDVKGLIEEAQEVLLTMISQGGI